MVFLQNVFFNICILYWILIYCNQHCHGYPQFGNTNSTNRIQRKSVDCGLSTFKCDNGHCISRYRLCDGNVDCADRSDENLRCSELMYGCPVNAFRCQYGACVDEDARCNGVQNCADNSDELDCTTRRPTSCGSQFTCNDGQCLNRYMLCDGVLNCADGSDEAYENCKDAVCPDYAYRCASGSCVDGDARCDGKRDCADGSDESPDICGRKPNSSGGKPVSPCYLPPQPANGRYTVQQLPYVSKITYVCEPGYKVYPGTSKRVLCYDGQWLPGIPECLRSCAPRVSDLVETICELDGVKQDCSKRMVEGTIVQMKCKHPYEQKNSAAPTLSTCRDGTWDFGLLACVPHAQC